MKKFLINIALLLICVPFYVVNAEILHSEKSLYRNITVVQRDDHQICIVFGRLSRRPDYQSCYNPDKPDYLVFSYTKLVMAGLSIKPDPKSILIIGLGGGTLPMSLEKVYPQSHIDTVEIDQAVLDVAKKWFSYKESTLQKTHILDGRIFTKRQLIKGKRYDLIILDAFNGDYIPEHMMTVEFLNEIKRLMNEDGLLISNTFSDNTLYDHESATYQHVFGSFNYVHSKKSSNRVIFTNKLNRKPSDIRLSSYLTNHLVSIGVNFNEFKDNLTSTPDWDQKARLLTDQYAPANLLNQ